MRMKSTIAVVIAVLFALTASSQKLSLLPQVGFENSKTNISYNNFSSFAPVGGVFSPQVSLRLDYQFKQGFGPFLSVSTSRSVISYNFNNLESGMNVFDAVKGDMQIRLEGGYQYTSKPIFLSPSKSAPSKTHVTNSAYRHFGSSSFRSRCSHSCRSSSSHCGEKNSRITKPKTAFKNTGMWMRLQPSFGVGYIPSVKPDVITKTSGGQTTYTYSAGNWKTAVIAGMGFEFGRKQQRLFTVSINYFNGIGNLGDQTISSSSGNKTSVAHLSSDASGWGVKIGIPFTLSQKKPVKKSFIEHRTYKTSSRCGQYRSSYRYHSIRSL